MPHRHLEQVARVAEAQQVRLLNPRPGLATQLCTLLAQWTGELPIHAHRLSAAEVLMPQAHVKEIIERLRLVHVLAAHLEPQRVQTPHLRRRDRVPRSSIAKRAACGAGTRSRTLRHCTWSGAPVGSRTKLLAMSNETCNVLRESRRCLSMLHGTCHKYCMRGFRAKPSTLELHMKNPETFPDAEKQRRDVTTHAAANARAHYRRVFSHTCTRNPAPPHRRGRDGRALGSSTRVILQPDKPSQPHNNIIYLAYNV